MSASDKEFYLYIIAVIVGMCIAALLAYAVIHALAWLAADPTHLRFFVTFYLLGCLTGYVVGKTP